MAGFLSPDWPAYICYALVLALGVLVGRARVNDRLAAYPDHWGFRGTWALLLAYSLLPIALFWFLDYTSVVRDTSLFAALVVAVGYQQIFAGGIQGVSLPGQTSALWKPFEAWVDRVAVQIQARHKQRRDRFDERVRLFLADDQSRLDRFEELVADHSPVLGVSAVASGGVGELSLMEQVAALKKNPVPGANLRRVRVLWTAYRASEPDNYAYFLRQSGILPRWRYKLYFGNVRSTVANVVALAAVTAVVLGGRQFGWREGPQRVGLQQRYHEWRFLKPNASPRDRHRSETYLTDESARMARDHEDDNLRVMYTSLLGELKFKDLPSEQADDILRLVMGSHSRRVDAVAVPLLASGLGTQNADVRLRIHDVLKHLQQADFRRTKLRDELTKWVPKPEESPGDVDRYVRLWRRWWQKAQRR